MIFFYFYNGTSDDIIVNVTDSIVESPNDSEKAIFDNGTIKLNMWRTNDGSRVGIIPAKGTIIFYDEFGQEITRQDVVKEEGDEDKYAVAYVPKGTKSFEIFNAISKRTYKVIIE